MNKGVQMHAYRVDIEQNSSTEEHEEKIMH